MHLTKQNMPCQILDQALQVGRPKVTQWAEVEWDQLVLKLLLLLKVLHFPLQTENLKHRCIAFAA